jgi:hypothetical protein
MGIVNPAWIPKLAASWKKLRIHIDVPDQTVSGPH